jgi:hypothetical protein
MPFKILKNAGFVPPEVERMRERAALAEALHACSDEAQRHALRLKLSELEQAIALRLESLKRNAML